jgi:hypothetical protein
MNHDPAAFPRISIRWQYNPQHASAGVAAVCPATVLLPVTLRLPTYPALQSVETQRPRIRFSLWGATMMTIR